MITWHSTRLSSSHLTTIYYLQRAQTLPGSFQFEHLTTENEITQINQINQMALFSKLTDVQRSYLILPDKWQIYCFESKAISCTRRWPWLATQDCCCSCRATCFHNNIRSIWSQVAGDYNLDPSGKKIVNVEVLCFKNSFVILKHWIDWYQRRHHLDKVHLKPSDL